jgi:DNA polymerase-3 subunit gamma/tau
MSYEVLARRWRPQSFDDLVGQRHVQVTLRNAIKSGRIPHALLLAGPRGVGKTSVARILARALNCDRGPTDSPCGECPSCRGILQGSSLDVQEIDAASHTGVDSVREIRDSIRYSAPPGKYRIYIIDEVHMLSQAAFNALLKTLEEPPPHSLFVLATTDPQRIPATVLSRVQRFDLRRLPAQDSYARLVEIAKSEKLEVPESVLRALVRESDGSLRDALTLLDRLVSGAGGKVDEQEAAAVLELCDRRVLEELLDAVLLRDPSAALATVRRALDQGVEPTRLASELLRALRDLIVARVARDPAELIDASVEEIQSIQARAERSDPEMLQRLFRVLLSRAQELPSGPRPEHALEMAIVRLATLPATESLEALIARLDELDAGPGVPPGTGGGGGGGAGSDGPRQAPAPAKGSAARTTPPRTRREPAAREESSARPPESEAAPASRAARLAKRRASVRDHPAVKRACEILDAEIRDIRLEPPS